MRCEEVQWDVDRRVVWLALEYMEGGDAQNLIDRRRNTSGEFFAAHFVPGSVPLLDGEIGRAHV